MIKIIKVGYVEYIVCDTGNIINAITNKTIKQSTSKDGYKCVNLGAYPNKIRKYVHRLVGECFIETYGKDINLLTINHKDYNKQNNNVSNLEWMTREQNASNSYKNNHKQIGETNSNAKLSEVDVKEIKQKLNCCNDKLLGKEYNVNSRTIYDIRHHNTWKHII